MERFDRNIRLFGAEGQRRIRASHVAVIGCGGLGEHAIQQLACLGVGSMTLVDDEELSETNRNRYVLARWTDPVPGTHKVDIAARAVSLIDPDIAVHPIRAPLRSADAFTGIRQAETVFGCVDNDGARLVLNELALAYGKKYFDLASDVEEGDILRYGGRVSLVDGRTGCLVCMGFLDANEAQRDLESAASRRDRTAVYGVDQTALDEVGPSVVSTNGVVASLAVTEFMVMMTGLRSPRRNLTYRADRGTITAGDAHNQSDCYFCGIVCGAGDRAGVERFLR